MAPLEIRLLGRPVVLIDGVMVTPPRGAKAWGLLAYLAMAQRPHTRPELAELLFGSAEDPLGALRWNLAAVRRLLDRTDAVKGTDISLDLPSDVVIDVCMVDRSEPGALAQPGLGQELLAGLQFSDCPAFETWLLSERRRLARRSASLLQDTTLTCLAYGDHESAIRHATQLAAADPLDEGCQALLIRAHNLAGDAHAARRQFDAFRELLHKELDAEPGPAVVAAANAAIVASDAQTTNDTHAQVEARLAVAWQSFLAGSVDHAIDLGRGVVVLADRGGDDVLRVFTRTFLGAMLAMAVRGWDEAGAILSEAIAVSEGLGRNDDAAMALGILAGNDMMRADYDSAVRRASAGLAMSEEPGARSINLMALCATEADTRRPEDAVKHVWEAMEAAEQSGDPVRIVYAAAHVGRVLVMHGQTVLAREPVERSAAMAAATMPTLAPWPVSLLAEIEIADGNLDAAQRHVDRAAATAATTGIIYQQALAARAAGLLEAARGNDEHAVDHLTNALALGRRTTGEGYAFHWPIAFVLDSLSAVTARDPATSRRWATALMDHANVNGMHEFTARAQRHLAGTSGV